MANIQDIARMAGVSVSTVSRVLNRHKYVSEAKRAAVQKVIDEMNYTPNRSAVDLIRGETKIIGAIIPYTNNQAFDQMLHGILNRSTEKDYSIIVLPSKYNPDKEIEYLSMLKNKLLDAMIITSRANPWEAIIPFAAFGSIVSCEYTEHPEIGCSYLDRYASYLEVFQLLKEKGHRRVAFTSARGSESNSTRQTMAAYEQVFGKPNPEYHELGCFSFEDGYRAGERLLGLNPRPTAIYANGDEVAGGIYKYARASGLSIPGDLAIIGQENQPIGVSLELSTVDHQLVKVGEQAFDLAMNKSREKVEMPYKLIHRSSI
ncbi:LacI family DNA-binding transcriptional regulator [Paenibacillus sp. M1]|uniref:LacI family DNA-binding transcriptional regulator n=1 Tax=Paenibacillus haidiansis TaxID=1574488 RepID=A0ABU7VV84_9BACL